MMLVLVLAGCGASVQNRKPLPLVNPEWMSISESGGRKSFQSTDTIYTGRDVLVTAPIGSAGDGTPTVFRIRSHRSDLVREVKGNIVNGKAEALWCVECLEPLSSIKKGEIVSYINRESAPIEKTTARIEREIELLREYRTRLIADVVTGKLDVREAAARLPKMEEAPIDETEIAEMEESGEELSEEEA